MILEAKVNMSEITQIRVDGQEGEVDYRALLDSTPEAILLADQTGYIRYANHRSGVIFGYTQEELIGTSIEQLLPDYIRPKHLRLRESYHTDLKPRSMRNGKVLEARRKDGILIPVRISLSPHQTERGVEIVAAIRDMSESIDWERKLLLQDLAIEAAADAFFLHDTEGRIVEVNQQACKSLGYARSDLLGLSIPDVEVGVAAEVIRTKCQALTQGNAISFKGIHRRKDGTTFPVEVRVSGLILENQKMMVAMARDVTERVEAEQKLSKLSERLSLATQAAGVGVWDWDVKRNVLIWDESMYTLYGLKKEDFSEAYEAWQHSVHPDEWERCNDAVQDALSGDKEFNTEFRILLPNENVKHIRAVAKVFRDKSGAPTRMLGVNSDVTELFRAKRWEVNKNRILEELLSSPSLSDILHAIVKAVEADDPSALCSICLMDRSGRCLLSSAAPSLPDFYNKAIHGLAIGDGVGSCGTAAFTGRRVIVEDVLTHPYWIQLRELARNANLRSCWSEPITTAAGRILGTFAIYHRTPTVPNDDAIQRIRGAADLTCLTIERKQTEEDLKRHQRHLEELVTLRTAELEAKTNELVAFNKSMLGRETRMIELKEEVNRLSREADRKQPYPPVWNEAL